MVSGDGGHARGHVAIDAHDNSEFFVAVERAPVIIATLRRSPGLRDVLSQGKRDVLNTSHAPADVSGEGVTSSDSRLMFGGLMVSVWSVRRTLLGMAAGVLGAAVLSGAALLPSDLARIAGALSVVAGVGLAVGVAVAAVAISRTLRGFGDAVTGLADGDLSRTLPVCRWREAAAVHSGLVTLVERLRPLVSLATEIHDTLTPAAVDLDQMLVNVSTAAKGTRDLFAVVEGSAEEVAANIQLIAMGAEEMDAAIVEIARNAMDAVTVAHRAAAAMASGTTTMNQLGDSSREIGDVIQLITSIAQQTNLLALNATIESARAGDAGKGFAVVAGEVKQLAQETARATDEVSRRVQAIQQDAVYAGQAIKDVAEMIEQINRYQQTIAGAMHEQEVTTHSMSAGITKAAQGSSTIASSIQGRSAIAGNAAAKMIHARQGLQDLGTLGERLGRALDRYRLPTGPT